MKRTIYSSRWRTRMLLGVLAGGTLLQISFSGCDSSIRDAVLSGVQTSLIGLVSTIINAFFLALMSESQTSQPIVQAVTDLLPHLT